MLPAIPYKGGKVVSQLLDFKGLNLSENYTDGEFVESSNLSTRNYPCITQRRGLEKLDGYVSPTDVFEWDGKLIVVDGGTLYYDGTPIDNVTPGKKQFAVVNTHLIVWPDKLDIDLTDLTFTRMAASQNVDSAVFTENTLTAEIIPLLETEKSLNPSFGGSVLAWAPLVYTYGKDKSAIHWDADNGWTLPVPVIKRVWNSFESSPYGVLEADDILIPSISGNALSVNVGSISASGTALPQETRNGDGKFCVFKILSGVISIYEGETHATIVTNMYYAGSDNILFSSQFSVGDRVTVFNEDNTLCRLAKITAIDDATNKLTFDGTPFTTLVTGGEWTVKREVPDMDYICESENRLWGVSNSTENVIIENGEVKSFTSRCIYASALGLPMHFWDFEGVDTDSYQVAVGSEGDFTGICNYNGVNCWKEKKLHRVYGSYPSEYYIGEYDIPGVANGSAHSLQIINEVLYYHGIYGIYAYNGNTPTLISYKLGPAPLTDAVSGSDGERLFLYAKRAGVGTLFTYDTLHGLWLADIIPGVTAFAAVGGKLYICANYEIKTFSDLAYEDFTWSVTFTPFFANVNANASTISSFNKKNFTRIHLRADMQLGSTLNVYVKYDNGEWQKVYTKEADSDVIIKVPIPISRCDHIQIKLDGTNGVTIRGLEREFARASHE